MLTLLAEYSGFLSVLNVFRYITFRTVVATVTVEKESYLDTISRLFRRFFHL